MTHPDMDWSGYQMRDTPSFILSERADIHHHRFADYLEAIEQAGLRLDEMRELAVDQRIARSSAQDRTAPSPIAASANESG